MKQIRRKYFHGYKNKINKCSNPDCCDREALEVHHIIPLYQGGDDNVRNIIVLCYSCHRGLKLHSDYENKKDMLLRWKAISEGEYLNYYISDDKSKMINNILNYIECNPSEDGNQPFPSPLIFGNKWKLPRLKSICPKCGKFVFTSKIDNQYMCINCAEKTYLILRIRPGRKNK